MNRKALKPILPDMAAGPVMFVRAAHVACQQPLRELTQCGLVSRFDNEMKAIGHQTETKHLNPLSFLRLSQERLKAS